MTPTSQRFLSAVALQEIEPTLYDRAFEAKPQYVPWPKAYGGDMVAQALAAAAATADSDRTVHSTHGYFLRPVDIDAPVRYEVEILRDGRAYSARNVRALQHGRVVFASMLSLHTGADSPEFQPGVPEMPAPESLPTSADALAGYDGDAAAYWSHGRSFDMRHVPSPLYVTHDGHRTPHQAVWLRPFDRLDGDARLHQVALAYVCDYTILEPALRVLGLHWSSPGLLTASLDHSMWFHRPVRLDDWLLYAQEAASVGSGRALATGRFFDRDGRLVATVAQEGLVLAP
ncbi:acyl-CoA thioesterase [Microbacterium sp. SSM24]|uniref:acyl-CoA thioesterase n=1 Tax=Microbacterium sp. SSM24 TaxID=2991714 RepID=UPI0022274D07|nr:acyl-CoA thioesterase domain-containing protein [Microbacterium sp. SSM24]MCW3492601.1 thioesterase family protein [Microbacterium sp. SSM24]